jgi:2-methylcitrate dehydratase PrpD
MGGLHAALDALFDIAAIRPLRIDEIAGIQVDLGHAVYHHGWWPPVRPLTPTAAQMNIGYVLAVAAIDRAALVHQFSPQRIDCDDVWTLIPRISARHDRTFDDDPMGRGQTRLTVRFTDGTALDSFQFAARSALNPLTNIEIVAKYRSLTSHIMVRGRQARLEQVILSLERQPGLAELSDLLAPPVASPFLAQ